MSGSGDLRSIVTWERGLIYPTIYFDEEIYKREHEQIFESAWMPVGHEDMVRNPGDYITNYIGEVPIILVKDRSGTVRVFINKCRHRGNEVCLFDRGNVRAFTCSYHGWTYGVDGRLISVPEEREFYHGALERENWGLEEAGVANFCGLVFATLNRDAPSFENWLGPDVQWWLQNFVLAEPIGGLEMLPGFHRYSQPANWKLIAENFIGDNYHFPHTHTSLIRVMKSFSEQGIKTPITTSPLTFPEPTYEVTGGYRSGTPLGLGVMRMHTDELFEHDLDNARAFGIGDAALDWIRERNDRMGKALAEYEPRPGSVANGLLFPNLGLMGNMSPLIGKHFLLFHPRGPKAHEIWQWTMVEKDAPEVVKELAVQRVYQGQHMAGLIAPDDVENFERIVEAMRSPVTWRYPMNYEVHLGHDEDLLPHIPGNCSAEPSEVNQRQFYRYWLELMERGRRDEEEEA
jgi:phenylpropionate dioxygenase-like ring-hydroxylating dioxygenase large terminal subunit